MVSRKKTQKVKIQKNAKNPSKCKKRKKIRQNENREKGKIIKTVREQTVSCKTVKSHGTSNIQKNRIKAVKNPENPEKKIGKNR